MHRIEIIPTPLRGRVHIPSSKSYCHRGILAAALAQGESRIGQVSFSDDIRATIAGVQAMGAAVQQQADSLCIRGGLVPKESVALDCKESGSTLRFLIPIALLNNKHSLFLGQGQLGQRPLEPYLKIFREQGISYSSATLPMALQGTLQPGPYELKGSVSSQFITGLLFALPLLKGDSTLLITEDLESKDYIAMTLQVLQEFGIRIDQEDERYYFIKGNQSYRPGTYRVEGDFSQAAFWLTAGALGGEIDCQGLNLHSRQGDKAILNFLSAAGVPLHFSHASIGAAGAHPLRAFTADVSQCPDIAPVLAVLASVAEGTSRILGAGRLRYKECDRLKAIAQELNKLGAAVSEGENSMTIIGKPQLEGGEADSWGDHRIAMALAVASLRCKHPVILHNSAVVSKSYPNFFEDFKRLGGMLHERNLG
jgi:3-phosphoshikimate 1-carboxyvinyltransferase